MSVKVRVHCCCSKGGLSVAPAHANVCRGYGMGAYGIVYKAHDVSTNQIVALKKIQFEVAGEGELNTALMPTAILVNTNSSVPILMIFTAR